MAEEGTEQVGSIRLRWTGEGTARAVDEHDLSDIKKDVESLRLFIPGEGKARAEDEHDLSDINKEVASLRLFKPGEGKARAEDEHDLSEIKEDEVSLRLFIPGDGKMREDEEERGSSCILPANFFGGERGAWGFLEKKALAFPFRVEDFVEDSDFSSVFFDFHGILSFISLFPPFFFKTGELELKGRGESSSSSNSAHLAPPRDWKPLWGFFKPANACWRPPLTPNHETI